MSSNSFFENYGCELLTVDELAKALKVSPSWVYEKTRLGEIPVLKVGKHNRYLFPHVYEALIQKNEVITQSKDRGSTSNKEDLWQK